MISPAFAQLDESPFVRVALLQKVSPPNGLPAVLRRASDFGTSWSSILIPAGTSP